MVYLQEAHADDMWPLGFGIRKHTNLSDRMTACRSFLGRHKELEASLDALVVDTMDDAFLHEYAAWPERYYIADLSGRVCWASGCGEGGQPEVLGKVRLAALLYVCPERLFQVPVSMTFTESWSDPHPIVTFMPRPESMARYPPLRDPWYDSMHTKMPSFYSMSMRKPGPQSNIMGFMGMLFPPSMPSLDDAIAITMMCSESVACMPLPQSTAFQQSTIVPKPLYDRRSYCERFKAHRRQERQCKRQVALPRVQLARK